MPVSISPDERSPLLQCPNEIRHLIYKNIIPINQELSFLLKSDEEDHFTAEPATRFPAWDASIFGTSRLLNEECTALFSKYNIITLAIGEETGWQPSTHPPVRLFYQQLRKMRRVHAKITLDLKFVPIRQRLPVLGMTTVGLTAVCEGAPLARQLIHRVAQIYIHSHLQQFIITYFSKEARTRAAQPQPLSQLQQPMHPPDATQVACSDFIRSCFEQALIVFGTLKNVQCLELQSTLLRSGYFHALQDFIIGDRKIEHLVEGLQRAPKLDGHQLFWLDPNGASFHHASFRQKEVKNNTTQPWITAVQLGPLRRSSRSVILLNLRTSKLLPSVERRRLGPRGLTLATGTSRLDEERDPRTPAPALRRPP
jgi:hypothetical protein